MDDPRDTLLKAEEQAQKIASQLSALKEKMEGHADAEQSLAETRTNLKELIAELVAGTSLLQNVVKTLGEIGTPEILEQINGVEEKIDDQVSKLVEGLSNFREVTESKLSKLMIFVYLLLGLNITLIIIQIIGLTPK
ncbi:MAG TPA: hypothetical protein ENF22_09385 [Chloroflexi bacterium]|nr:hypothetical protein [Chloroflexota bacterium]